MKALPDFKRGDTFTASCVYKIDGVPTTLAGKAIAAQIRTADGTLIDALAVAIPDQVANPGRFTLSATATQTALWPVAGLRCDIQFTQGGAVQSTDTFLVPVVQDITK